MKKLVYFIKTTLVLCIALISLNCVEVSANEDRAHEGVYFEDVQIGGKTREETQTIVEEFQSEIQEKTISIKAKEGSKPIQLKLSDFDLQVEKRDYAEEAINVGTTGNLINRYKDVLDSKNGKKIIKATYVYEDAKLKEAVEKVCKKNETPAKEPTVSFEGSAPTVTKLGEKGVKFDPEDAYKKIKEKISDWDSKKNLEVEADAEITKPKVTEDMIKQCTDVVGEYETKFNPGDNEKTPNLKAATGYINGSVVAKGETFSILSKISPCTTARGYVYGKAFQRKNGELTTVQAIGGGICQVSTTLYNAALYAEAEIVERNCHSGKVGYLKTPSSDAMLNEGSSDLKFKNTFDAPMCIQAYVNGGTIGFKIYSKENRPSNRTVEFVGSEQSSGNYTYAQLYKIVKVDGVQKEKTKINDSRYEN